MSEIQKHLEQSPPNKNPNRIEGVKKTADHLGIEKEVVKPLR